MVIRAQLIADGVWEDEIGNEPPKRAIIVPEDEARAYDTPQ
ncbi:hypothetical protein HNR46_003785 [Haloferula luteola]|uniref:Uncharacterized protein n=1 Tax=Haloferula luteola TaxID=595692 RepID=A0A840VDD8_9BACT|nr:hypothetical protein [Haloferula luteola]